MRPKERIPIFLKLVNWSELQNRWGISYNHTFFIKTVEKYWLDNYDQRIGQVLINLDLIPDSFNIWSDEESDILKDQGIEPREFLFWGNIYDKDMNRLEKTRQILIKDLNTDHIKAILKMFEDRDNLNPLYKETFLKELELRKRLPGYIRGSAQLKEYNPGAGAIAVLSK